MPAHSVEVVKKFCELCDWLLQIWQARKMLFDDNPDVATFREPRHAHLFYRLQEVVQENWLHQLAKLHDPAVQSGQKGHINLSIDYMIEYGQWSAGAKSKLVSLQAQMLALAKPVKDARNKILSHNDLAVLLAGKGLGAFDPSEDEPYFAALRSFASAVSEEVLGEPFLYDDLVRNDVAVFMHDFLRGRSA